MPRPGAAGRSARRLPRYLTSPLRALPDFLVIGAMRSGTTSLFQWLVDHPGVVPATKKEIHFFDAYYARGAAWYRSHFPTRATLRRRGGRTGEGTPYYLFHPLVPARLKELVPDARLLVVLRDPVARTHSHYQHEVDLGREPLDFAAALDAEEGRLAGREAHIGQGADAAHRDFSYVARSLYAEQLERWLAIFPAEQLLVLSSEELFSSPAGALRQVAEHVGVAPVGLDDFPHRNLRPYEGLDPAVQTRLQETFRAPNERLFGLLDRELPWGARRPAD